MASMTFLTPDEVKPGFELAGLRQQICRVDQTEAVIEDFINGNREGILAIDERLLESVSQNSLLQLERRWEGIFVIIPSPERPEAGAEDYAVQMLKRVLGYHVRMEP